MTALGALMVHDAEQLCAVADVAGAMTLEAVKGTLAAFDPRVAVVRPHPGAAASAANVRRVGAGSAIHASHADCGKVQDAYSLRCIPQVHGATRDALAHARAVLEREANSVTDNPLLFPDTEDVLSAGNFHGQPVALVLDYAKLAVCELANISERRTAHLMDPGVSGLPAFLAPSGGLHSGLMIVQYTAASLVSENKVLAHPASADSIPTSANQEDHVSMGTTSARHARQALENAEWVVAIELLCAAQGLDFHRPLRPGAGHRRGARGRSAPWCRARGRPADAGRPARVRAIVAVRHAAHGGREAVGVLAWSGGAGLGALAHASARGQRHSDVGPPSSRMPAVPTPPLGRPPAGPDGVDAALAPRRPPGAPLARRRARRAPACSRGARARAGASVRPGLTRRRRSAPPSPRCRSPSAPARRTR
jgi:hypothetical protein